MNFDYYLTERGRVNEIRKKRLLSEALMRRDMNHLLYEIERLCKKLHDKDEEIMFLNRRLPCSKV